MEKISQTKLLTFSWMVMLSLLSLIVLFVFVLPEQEDTINALTLSIRDMFILIIGYWFGSSKGSSEKESNRTEIEISKIDKQI